MHKYADTQWALRLQAEFDQCIPLSRAIGIRVVAYNHRQLELSAPLEPNINDKGTAFGGSISCLLTLAAWGVVWIGCARNNIACDIVIHKGTITYSKPLRDALHAYCSVPEAAQMKAFYNRLKSKGRSRIALTSELRANDETLTVFECQYAALLTQDKE